MDGATVRAQVRFDSETTGEGAAKAIRQKLLDNARGSYGIVGLHERGEHGQ